MIWPGLLEGDMEKDLVHRILSRNIYITWGSPDVLYHWNI